MKHKNTLKNGLFAFLMTIAIIAKADPARVISKEEGIPHTNNTTRTRIFLDITPNDENNRADAYVYLNNINRSMSMREFSDMIQVGDIIEYLPDPSRYRDGRYTVISFVDLLELNGDNIYRIFLEELEDSARGSAFTNAERAYYEARRRGGQSQAPGGGQGTEPVLASLPPALPAPILGKRERET